MGRGEERTGRGEGEGEEERALCCRPGERDAAQLAGRRAPALPVATGMPAPLSRPLRRSVCSLGAPPATIFDSALFKMSAGTWRGGVLWNAASAASSTRSHFCAATMPGSRVDKVVTSGATPQDRISLYAAHAWS